LILPDVNVLVYAFREAAPRHSEYRNWLLQRLESRESFGCSDLVLSGVLRVLTHPRVFAPPTPLSNALEYTEALRTQPNAVWIKPGARHWELFTELCVRGGAKGNLVPDAWLAGLALEHGCELVTTDRDFARFPGLRWRHPLED
jgi:toxin-antitoxin system PIN domain toxin